MFLLFCILRVVLGATIDHVVSSDEDEPILNLNHIGHDAENEGLYPFKRSSTNQYHKVSVFGMASASNPISRSILQLYD